jgi:hypothetical protein
MRARSPSLREEKHFARDDRERMRAAGCERF